MGGLHSHSHSHGHGHGHGHGHSHSHLPSGSRSVPSALIRALAVTGIFMVIEFVGGWIANSLALLSDAAHMLTDMGALSLSLFAWIVSRRPSSARMSFGYQRAEVLGALMSGVLIWVLAGGLIYEAVNRFQEPPMVDGKLVVIIGAIGLLANLISMSFLKAQQHSNMNVRAAYLHVLADSLGSVAAILSGALIWIWDLRIADPIITVLVSVLIFLSSWRLVRDSVGVLMESTPRGIDLDQVRSELEKVSGVKEAHDLHIWTVSSGRLALSVHLVADRDHAHVLEEANNHLESTYGIVHTTIQIEHPEQFRSDRCYDCAY